VIGRWWAEDAGEDFPGGAVVGFVGQGYLRDVFEQPAEVRFLVRPRHKQQFT
jgi:hypothetical protein